MKRDRAPGTFSSTPGADGLRQIPDATSTMPRYVRGAMTGGKRDGVRGRRLARRVASAAMCVVALSTAAAADPWSAPSEIPAMGYQPAGLGFTASGNGILALAWRGVDRPALQAAMPPSGGFGPLSALTRSEEGFQFRNLGLGRQLAVFGRDGVVATGVSRTRLADHPWLAFGRIGHRLGHRRRLAIPGWSGGSLALAANPRGDVALIAVGCGGCIRGSALYLFYRTRGERLGRPVRVARVAYDQEEFASGVAPTVAINAAGDALVAWAQRASPVGTAPWRLYARIRRGARWLRPPWRLGDLLSTGAIVARLTRR
jgi:hypothetical protein